MRNLLTMLLTAALLGLAGCGGGGGNPAIPTDPRPEPLPAGPQPIVQYQGEPQVSMIKADVFRARTGADGTGTTIAVVDTGVHGTHKEFSGRIDPASAGVNINGTYDASGNSQLGSIYYDANYDDIVRQEPVPDAVPHGTHVAGIAAGATKGVAPGASIMAVRVFQEADYQGQMIQFTDESMIVAGIAHAINNGADVVNLSLSINSSYSVGTFVLDDQNVSKAPGADSRTSFQYVRDLVANNDVALIASAGNNSDPTGIHEFMEAKTDVPGERAGNLIIKDGIIRRSLMFDPATEKKVLYVIAADWAGHTTDASAFFTSFAGDCRFMDGLDQLLAGTCDAELEQYIQNHFITAPGVDISSADGRTEEGFTNASGTSMAAPVVSGAYALIKSN